MKSVLFVGHGSKKKEGNEGIWQFVEKLKPQLSVPIIETCFLEFASPTLTDGIDACASRGATEVAVVPIMFFPAGHSKIHIPHAIDEAKSKYPHIQFQYGRPIGIHEEMFTILVEKLQAECGFNGSSEEQTTVLIVGRGSSDVDANSEMYKLSRILSEKLDMAPVEVSFIGVTNPTVEEGVERSIRLGAEKVIVVPYFFFTGILMDRMEEKIERYRLEFPETSFAMTEPIGLHERLNTVLIDRAHEALDGEAKLNCDTCQYRHFALEHMDIDHHHDHDHHHHS